jgi:hypothetical protein
VKRKHLHAGLCSNEFGASTVAVKTLRQLSMSGVTTLLKMVLRSHLEVPKEKAALYNPREEYVEITVG